MRGCDRGGSTVGPLGSSEPFDALWSSSPALQTVSAAIIWRSRDTFLPSGMLRRWRAGLPHAVVTELDRSGHWPHEEQPDEALRSLRTFLPLPASGR